MRGRVLLVAFVVFALAAAVLRGVLAPDMGPAPADPRVSAGNTTDRGARALYLWLARLGHPTRSWRKPLTAITADQEALFVLEPTQDITPDQADALLAWVEKGGTLFVAPGYDVELDRALEQWVILDFDDTEASDVRGDRVVPDEGMHWRYRETRPEERGLFEYPVDEVAFLGNGRVSDPTGEHSLLFCRAGQGLVAEVFHGDGVIIVFPEADFLTNRGLAKAGNAELVASVVEDWVPKGSGIWFDEYDHGARVAGSLPAYLGRRRPGLFAAALLAAGTLLVLRRGRALVVRPDEERGKRRRPTEFVDALGSLYARSHAVAPAWTALARAGRRIARGELAGVGGMGGAAEEREGRRERLRGAASGKEAGRSEKDLVRLAKAVARALATGEERS